MKNIIEKGLNLYKKNKEVINYLFFGGVTTIICLVVYYILTFTVLDPNVPVCLQIANIISWIVGVVFAYITNRKYVFVSKNENILKEIKSFVITRILTLILDNLINHLILKFHFLIDTHLYLQQIHP